MPRAYRTMTRADDGKPVAAASARALGVRVPPDARCDIEPDGDGNVHPGTGDFVDKVLAALRQNWNAGKAWMAEEFRRENSDATVDRFLQALAGIDLAFERHNEFKTRVPNATGLIRTGDTIQYANIILESA